MNSKIVYPADRVDRTVIRDLEAAHPDILLLRHPVWGTWQLYENPMARRGSWHWTAERLSHAIVAHHTRGREIGGSQWAKWPGAPHLIETLPRDPGTWLIRYVREKDFGRIPGGAMQWFRDLEEEEERKKAARRRDVTDMHDDVARSGFHRHARDAMDGDSLAGHRRWVRSPWLKEGL